MYDGLALPIIEARLDWLSCSSLPTSEGEDLIQLAAQWQEVEAQLGYQRKPWGAFGYSGWQTRHVRWGWSEQGGFAAFSGEMADRVAPVAAKLAAHWSRCDYCVTVRDDQGRIQPDEDYWHEWRRLYTKQTQPRKLRRVQECWGGSTIYIGERSSAYYVRIYDKHAESEGDYPVGSWRFEVELKRHASEGQHARYKQASPEETYGRDLVATELSRLRLSPPWLNATATERDPQVRHRPDTERIIAWLARGVAPAVSFASEAAGTDAVLKALGLPRVAYGGWDTDDATRSYPVSPNGYRARHKPGSASSRAAPTDP